MKENPYDEDIFFHQYSQFPRSVQGLKAAGEWHALKALLPDFQGKRVLDLGCGFGWHCAYAAQQGAAQVLGTDISRKMLERAMAQTREPQVSYRQIAMELTSMDNTIGRDMDKISGNTGFSFMKVSFIIPPSQNML